MRKLKITTPLHLQLLPQQQQEEEEEVSNSISKQLNYKLLVIISSSGILERKYG
jgi:hypothetical protein